MVGMGGLQAACNHKHINIIKLMIEKGAKWDAPINYTSYINKIRPMIG